MNNEIATILIRICKIFGDFPTADKIIFREKISEKKLYLCINNFVNKLERKYKTKLFEFKDKTNRGLIRYYVIDCYGGITITGEPTIMINDFPEGVQADKNPVLRLELVYDNIDTRDEDLEELKFMIK